MKRILVPGLVPKRVTAGELHTLLVCVNPAAALLGKGACRKAARIATSGTSTEERIAGAQQAGRLSETKGILFALRALRPDKRLPRELRGDLNGPGGDQAPIMAVASVFGSLRPTVQRQVLPYFVPPRGVGSAWSSHSRTKRSMASAVDCKGYGKLDGGGERWRGVPTSDGKAIVWYIVRENPRWKQIEADERAAAYRYARELPKIWKKLSKEFGPPRSDAAEPCYHGPDGRLDVYVDDEVVWIEGGYSRAALAVAVPYPRGGTFCSDRPAWLAIRGALPNWALAHELMHAIQFAHRYASCEPPPNWWNEGQATWAADFVYPNDNYEQREYPQLVTQPLGYEVSNSSYAAWPFWMMLERTQGVGVLRSVFANLRTKDAVHAVDSAISGGFARQLPRFFVHVYNQSPVGDPGFEIAKSFKAWDKWSATPSVRAPTIATLGGMPEDTLVLHSESPSVPRLSFAGYQRVTIPDDSIKELKFTNDLAGKAGGHVDALLHLVDGSWKLADWSKRKEVILCRDKPEENVSELVIVNSNASLTAPLGAFTHKLRVRPGCGPHFYKVLNATLNETWTATQAPGWPGCSPYSGVQTNTMTLSNTFEPGNNRLFELPGGMLGMIGSFGMETASTTMHGCDIGSDPVFDCTRSGTMTMTAGVSVQVIIPPNSPTAELHWTLSDPDVGLGNEGAGTTCILIVIGGTVDDETIGQTTVPSEVFEAETPQTISIDVDFDLTNPVGGQIHASETYVLTIQRVREDGSPL